MSLATNKPGPDFESSLREPYPLGAAESGLLPVCLHLWAI